MKNPITLMINKIKDYNSKKQAEKAENALYQAQVICHSDAVQEEMAELEYVSNLDRNIRVIGEKVAELEIEYNKEKAAKAMHKLASNLAKDFNAIPPEVTAKLLMSETIMDSPKSRKHDDLDYKIDNGAA